MLASYLLLNILKHYVRINMNNELPHVKPNYSKYLTRFVLISSASIASLHCIQWNGRPDFVPCSSRPLLLVASRSVLLEARPYFDGTAHRAAEASAGVDGVLQSAGGATELGLEDAASSARHAPRVATSHGLIYFSPVVG
jgi:hypothetical protein